MSGDRKDSSVANTAAGPDAPDQLAVRRRASAELAQEARDLHRAVVGLLVAQTESGDRLTAVEEALSGVDERMHGLHTQLEGVHHQLRGLHAQLNQAAALAERRGRAE